MARARHRGVARVGVARVGVARVLAIVPSNTAIKIGRSSTCTSRSRREPENRVSLLSPGCGATASG
ncbi:MAG TPA: hypothetical protein VNW92_12080 [Polyangiaceae bacterium]|nr:hypothetical protein [Polyangiaceae bacterium]